MAKRNRGRTKKFYEKAGVVDIKSAREARRDARRQKMTEGEAAAQDYTCSDYSDDISVEEANWEQEDTNNNVRRKGNSRRRYKRGRRLLIYGVVVAIFVIAIGMSGYEIVTIKLESRQLRLQEEKLKQEKKNLQEELKKVNDPEYIEQQARKQLKLILPGETLYVLPNKNGKDKK